MLKRVWITCVRWRYALRQHAICDDIEDTEREHHWYHNETKLKHVGHQSLKHTKTHILLGNHIIQLFEISSYCANTSKNNDDM